MTKDIRLCEFCSYSAVSDAQMAAHLNRYHEGLLAQRGNKAHREKIKDEPHQDLEVMWFKSFDDRDMLSMVTGLYR